MASITPKKLAIYYGYPSLVNGSNGNIIIASNNFKVYDMIIFGANLEQISHSDHNNTVNIINHQNMTNTQIFGYIDSTISLNNFKNRVDLWKNMGAKGIFADRFGYDYSVNRIKQNTIINYIHSKGLIAFVNAWNVDDVFSQTINLTNNPLGIPTVINSNDWYLAQSYQIINGAYQNENDWKNKSDKMVQYKQIFGTKIACATTYDLSQFDQNKMDYSYFSTILYNFDAYCFGEYNFSANNSLLPFRLRKIFYGTNFVNNITYNNSILSRRTNVGIKIDTVNHTADYII